MDVIKEYYRLDEFCLIIDDYMKKYELMNLHMYGMIEQLKNLRNQNIRCIGVFDQDEIKLAMIISTKRTVVSGCAKYACKLVKYLAVNNIKIDNLYGDKDIVYAIGMTYAKMTNKTFVVVMNQRLYTICSKKLLVLEDANFRKAQEKDTEILTCWIKEHFIDSNKRIDEKMIRSKTSYLVDNSKVYVIESDNEEIASMAVRTFDTQNGSLINNVFTPKKLRNRGYAKRCVASLTKEILNDKNFCALFTDLTNEISNSMYMKIGYIPVCDYVISRIK